MALLVCSRTCRFKDSVRFGASASRVTVGLVKEAGGAVRCTGPCTGQTVASGVSSQGTCRFCPLFSRVISFYIRNAV